MHISFLVFCKDGRRFFNMAFSSLKSATSRFSRRSSQSSGRSFPLRATRRNRALLSPQSTGSGCSHAVRAHARPPICAALLPSPVALPPVCMLHQNFFFPFSTQPSFLAIVATLLRVRQLGLRSVMPRPAMRTCGKRASRFASFRRYRSLDAPPVRADPCSEILSVPGLLLSLLTSCVSPRFLPPILPYIEVPCSAFRQTWDLCLQAETHALDKKDMCFCIAAIKSCFVGTA
jgi:hypothetical protein